MIATARLRPRNRLAEVVVAAVRDADARRTLAALADEPAALAAWLEPEDGDHADRLRRRARAASGALAGLPLATGGAPSLVQVLAAAAALFDAGLGFEVHELLEPHWTRADGETREALQGLIQVAVGYQHLANGNRSGARALLEEGAARIAGRRLHGLDLDGFARGVAASVAAGLAAGPPPFPRKA